ncbi:MAG: hypothetical protein O9293_01570 [Porphyrobacter sp.]|nr:hypothetical protein [Porphyrobacter sp.]
MKFVPLAALGLAFAAMTSPVAVLAQDAPAPAPAPAFTIDTPIETLMADERAKAVLAANFGGQDLSQHPAYEQFKALSLKTLAPFSQGLITDEMLTKMAADLAAIQ